MKVKALIALILCSIILFSCSTKHPPTQVGKTQLHSSMSFPYHSLSEYIASVDIYAEIEITKWLGENEVVAGATYYEAKILKAYKNTKSAEMATIKFYQTGCSEHTLKGYPLFAVGDKLLLGFKYYNDMADPNDTTITNNELYKDYYYIEGSFLGALQIKNDLDAEYMLSYVTTPFSELKKIGLSDNSKGSKFKELESKLNSNLQIAKDIKIPENGFYTPISDRTIIKADDVRSLLTNQ